MKLRLIVRSVSIPRIVADSSRSRDINFTGNCLGGTIDLTLNNMQEGYVDFSQFAVGNEIDIEIPITK